MTQAGVVCGRMGSTRVLYAIAESCPFDALLVKEMRQAVNSLLQLNLKRFRVPEKVGTKYSALDIMKQCLELLFEFSPSNRNYREAMRTIQVYSEGDEEMLLKLRSSFTLIANAVYNAYAGQRHAESVSPELLFLQGVPIEPTELQQAFRFVGVKPPDICPPSVKATVFLDEGFEPYKFLLEGRITPTDAQVGREEHWAHVIESAFSKSPAQALIRAGVEHLTERKGISRRFVKTGKLPVMLRKSGISLEIIHQVSDVNVAFGKG
jgi:hypothetical protein